MLKRLAELLERHKVLEDLRQADERDLSEEELNEEQDEIIATVFCFIRDKLPELKRIHSTLEKVQSVIECTHADESDDDDEDGDTVELPPSNSAADIVEMLCDIEGVVDESLQILGDTDASGRTATIVCVYDAPSANEAIYKNGELFDSDFTMYAGDVARATGDAPAKVLKLNVALPPEIEWPPTLDALMRYETEED